MIDVLALGEILIDFTPDGTNGQGMALFARNPGGAPANVLAMNARLGGVTALIGKVGKDGFGDFLRQTMINSNIDISGMVTDESVPTTLAFVQLDGHGDRSFTFYRHPGADMMLASAEVRREQIDDCAIFHFGSVSLTDDPSRTATFDAAAYAKKQGKLISFDPNYRPLLWESETQAKRQMERGVCLADLLKVSEEEMTLITGETDLERGSQMLLEMGPSLVLVSLGAQGAFYRNQICFGQLPTYDVKTMDTTGAGDAFVGAVHYRLRGKSILDIGNMSRPELEDMVDFANAAGSLTTAHRGAIPAMPGAEEIAKCRSTVPFLKKTGGLA